MKSLALALRPRTADRMIGAEKVARNIRGLWENDALPPVMMFVGETGTGKTTLARILSVALQCKHQEKWGNPCKACYKRFGNFDIVEINAGDITGINELREALAGSDYDPRPGSLYRAFIIDEAQGLSKAAKTLLLKYTEDCPDTTKYFICTTDPQTIPATNQSRCQVYKLPGLTLKGVRKLVRRGLAYRGSELDSEPIIDALNEKQVTSPRMVLQAVDKYIASSGADPEAAALVLAVSEIDTHNVCRAVIKGDWEGVAKLLRDAKSQDTIAIQASVCGYLKAILLDEIEFSERATVVAKSIRELSTLSAREDGMQLAGVAAVLYSVCKYFKEHKR